MITGTSYFVSKEDAVRYYRDYEGDLLSAREIVDYKLSQGEIHIGQPPMLDGDKLVLLDGGKRYGIEDGKK